MSTVLGELDIQTLDMATALLRDYVRGAETDVSKLLRRYPGSWAESAAQCATAPKGELWTVVVDEIESLSSRVGAREDVLRKLDGAKVRETCFVVTGQQPGALGGPLHTVYKIATAIALADRIERETGHPCLALYWLGADDSDFQEVRSLSLWTDQLSPVSTAIVQSEHQAGMPVGDIGVDAISQVFAQVQPLIRAFPSGPAVSSLVDNAFEVAGDHGELSAAILTALFDGRYVTVDGRSDAVRRFAQPVFRSYLAKEADIKTTVNATGRRLNQLGYQAQLVLGDEPGVFVLEGGRRKSLAGPDRAPLRKMVEESVANLSPGVVLRNLIQDFTFRPLAAVLGPAELAYRAQMTPIYPEFDIMCPVSVPRLTATFVPPALADVVELHGGDLPLLIERPAEFARATYRDALPKRLRDAAEDFNSGVSRMVDAFIDDHLGALPGKSRGKVTSRLKEVSRRAEGAVDAVVEGGKSAAMERWPFLADLPDLIRPRHKAQERNLSVLVPFLLGDHTTGGTLTDMAAAHIDQLMDDRMSHIVYSSSS